jgi:hypothetical protein
MPKGAYYVAYTVYPPELIKKGNPQTLLDKVREGAISSAKADLVSEKMISIDNHPGREIVFTVPGEDGKEALNGKGRFYLVKNRLYQATIYMQGTLNEFAARQFLNSFKLQP